ncbi:MAG: zinc ABC transporter substrate-binding protein [Pseudomonadota bacterium]
MNTFLVRTYLFLIVFFISTPVLAAEKHIVFVSIEPQKYFVQEIGKDLIEVMVMVQPGANPATYEPRASQMAALSKARLYFSIGVPFENTWLKKISAANPDITMIHTDQGIQKIPMATFNENADGSLKGHEDHGHEGLDPHIWLSPELVKVQAKIILKALKELDPLHQAVYEKNFHNFITRIEKLDENLHYLFKTKKGLRFMVFHPSWGYFANAYGLEQIPIEIEGKNPKPAQLNKLIRYARNNNINIIFVQPQFSTKSAKLIAQEIKGHIVFADPLSGDWMINMWNVAQKFMEALK